MSNDRYVSFKNGEWQIRKDGHRRATAFAPSRSAALVEARGLVAADGGGRVLLLNEAGKVTRSIRVGAP